MSYTALYRKFRPDNFEDVKGQDHIVTTLTNQINANRIGHAYLFCGTRGTGKTTVAKIFAKAVNCEHPVDGSPCGECAMCKSIAAGTSMNVIEIDAASNNGVDNIREIREEVTYRPTEGRYKVYIIDEVHMLSTGAFNALLKTLEEPPSYVIFILATTEAHKIPITILSRCQRYDCRGRLRRDDRRSCGRPHRGGTGNRAVVHSQRGAYTAVQAVDASFADDRQDRYRGVDRDLLGDARQGIHGRRAFDGRLGPDFQGAAAYFYGFGGSDRDGCSRGAADEHHALAGVVDASDVEDE